MSLHFLCVISKSCFVTENFKKGCHPGGGAVKYEVDTGVRPALQQAGALGESTGSKNEGSLGESMIFGIQ